MSSFIRKTAYTGPVQGVVLDWAGTAVDFGCMGPVEVFRESFHLFDIDISVAEVRQFMGLMKKDHIRRLGKGLGGGIFPLAAMIAREDLDIASDSALGHYTHEKNPVACAAGLAALDVIENEGLVSQAEKLGQYALDRLCALMKTHPLIGDVRGQGLLFGAELVQNRKSKIPAEMEADQVMYACLKRGLSFKVSQGNFLTLTPPLTMLRCELDQAIDTLDAVLAEVENEAG